MSKTKSHCVHITLSRKCKFLFTALWVRDGTCSVHNLCACICKYVYKAESACVRKVEWSITECNVSCCVDIAIPFINQLIYLLRSFNSTSAGIGWAESAVCLNGSVILLSWFWCFRSFSCHFRIYAYFSMLGILSVHESLHFTRVPFHVLPGWYEIQGFQASAEKIPPYAQLGMF